MSFKKFLLAVLSVPNSNASFRDRTNLEIKWHRVMHQVFINDAMVEQTKAAVENLEKVKKGLLNFYKSLEEKKIIWKDWKKKFPDLRIPSLL